MPKTYLTFGQVHRHVIKGEIFDCNCVAVLEVNTAAEGRRKAFSTFGRQFCFEYFDKPPAMHHYPRGFIEVKD